MPRGLRQHSLQLASAPLNLLAEQVMRAMGDRETFLLEEYRVLKAEITALVASANTSLQWAALASGGVFAWLFSSLVTERKDASLVPVPLGSMAPLGFVPLVLSVVLALQCLAAYLHIAEKGCYLRKLEHEFLAQKPPANHVANAEPPGGAEIQGAKFGLSFWTHVVAWVALIGANAWLGTTTYRAVSDAQAAPAARSAPAAPSP